MIFSPILTCNVSTSTDDRGRIYLPKEVRKRFGDEYRIVQLPGQVVLFPVDDDPIAGILEAVDGSFDDISEEGMRDHARSIVSEAINQRNTDREE